MEETNSQEIKDDLNDTENIKKPIITFAKANRYFIIPFLCPIFCMLANYFSAKIIKANVIKKVEFVFSIFLGQLSYVLGGLFHFASYFRSKANKINRPISNKIMTYIYNKNANSNKFKFYKKFFFVLLFGILIGFNGFVSLSNTGKKIFEHRLYYLFFIPLFSKFILKENIYKHQYLSLIIAIIGLVLLFFPVCLLIKQDDIIPNILNFFCGILYSLFIVLIKYIIQKYYESPLKLSIYFGISAMIVTFIGFSIYSLIEYKDFSYFKNLVDFSEVENKIIIVIYIIFTILFAITLRVLTLLSLFYFSPTLIMIVDIISPMLLWVANTIQDGPSMPDVIVNPIGYIFALFSSLIYNEIIIFNFCDFSKNTKIFVEQRINEEIQLIDNDLNSVNSQNNVEESLNNV